MKSLKPSHRENKRYILIKGEDASKENIDNAILEFIGVLGYAEASPQVVKHSVNSVVLAMNTKSLNKIRASFMMSNKDLSIVKVSGTLKKLRWKRMKVKIPEPVGVPLINYEKKIKNKRFNSKELTELVRGFEENLNNLSLKLDKRTTILSYNLIFERADNSEIIEHMGGGFDLSVRGGREYAMPDFKRRYKETFKSILEKAKNSDYPLNIEISIIGFGDKITHKIEAKC